MLDEVAELRRLLIDDLGADILLDTDHAAVAAPTDDDHVAELLACCRRHGLRVIPTGGTKADVMPDPEGMPAVWCSTTRMRRIVDIAAADLTARVQAGCTITELNDALSDHGLVCPIDPAAPDATTVGAMIAANRSGPSTREDGTVADHLLAGTVVTPAFGRICAGAATAKSVAGYDVHRLMVGSHGQYGVVTEATLRLIPRPRAWAFACVTADGPRQLSRYLRSVLSGRTRPAVVDILDSRSAPDLGLAVEPGGLLLCVGYRGEPDTVAWQVAAVAEDLSEATAIIDGTAAAGLYEKLRDWPAGSADLSFEAVVRLERCVTVMTFCQRADLAAIARAGCGVVYGRVSGALTASDVLALRATAGEDSTVVFAQAPDNGAFKRWPPLSGAAWLRHIKDLFDPGGVLPWQGLADGMNDE